MANQIRFLHHVRLIEQSAIIDPLTGALNRRGYDNRLGIEWANARREQTPISIVAVDADHFKLYNDHFGHPQGDVLLQSLTRALSSAVRRPMDFVARIGGEEFSIVLPHTDLNGAAHIAEQVRQAVEDLKMPHPASPTADHVTISVGVGSIIPSASDDSGPHEFVEQCDKALYAAKTGGRNRVETATT